MVGLVVAIMSIFSFHLQSIQNIGLSVSLSHGMMFELAFCLDSYSVMFGAVVGIISGSVLIFSEFYMADEAFKNRFCGLILLFVGSMFVLLIADNMMALMIGWDGLGLVSFCLVGYYDSKSSLSASMLTLMTNRVGDVMFLVVISLLIGVNSMYFDSIEEMAASGLVMLMILIGSATKSAQIPFSAWLPAAMAAPTPVSTLVHSSTLVTAGLYVMFRFSSSLSGGLGTIMFVMGFFTALMASSCATVEADIKKIVALSTLSQLGLINLGLSIGMSDLAFFHLIVHALFKALMFMCVGCVIMSEFGAQEIRRISGLSKKMPTVSMWLLVASMSLSGFPMMAGFFSKDLLLEAVVSSGMSVVCLGVFFFLSLLTVCYSWRLVTALFSFSKDSVVSLIGEPLMFFVCTSVLGLGSVLGAKAIEVSMLELNNLMVVNEEDKILLSLVVLISVVMFSFITPSQRITNVGLVELLNTMFFLSVTSGSPISKKGLNFCMKNGPLVEVGMEYYLGEWAIRTATKKAMKISGVPLHWGAWGFFVYYLAVICVLFLIIFMVV
uniref:NADH-ubiquinone oxidoreductase chain 5 n=1 Tax=Tridacna squamosa TaxID=80830 RepID=A0A0U1YXU4_TRISQ|nr:NADH dehydrogenase subunit 5 [Tridacna squamosa]AJK90889.1 NADH dehydrogenase subunit 5 [Tridacna squamosa]